MHNDQEYTVTEEYGCTVIRGSVPLLDMANILESAPKGSVMNIQLAGMLKAVAVIGTPDACRAALKSLGFTTAPSTEMLNELSTQERIDIWRLKGEVGSSALTMANALTGHLAAGQKAPHPLDPADFRRCALFLRWVPELRVRICELEQLSPQWKAIVSHWDEFEHLLDEEVPGWDTEIPDGHSVILYERMNEVIRNAQ